VVTKSLKTIGASGGSEGTVEKTAALTYGVASATSYRVLLRGLCTVRYRRHGFDPQDRAPSNIKRADEFACRLQSDSSFTGLSVEDCVSQACKYHPLRTRQTSRLHPNLFLLSPSQDTQKKTESFYSPRLARLHQRPLNRPTP